MRAIAIILATATWAGAAMAADKPIVAPTPAWVRPVALPAEKGNPGEAAFLVLLQDEQVALEPGRRTVYQQVAARIQTPQGLALGNISFAWRPETEVLTVHKLLIRRGAQVIDVLGSGQTFTVVRREANLESATLDGVLTATIQPEGLQVGDVIDFAASISSSDPTLKSHVEHLGGAWNGVPISRAHLRVQWPTAMSVRVQSRGMAALRPITRGDTKSVEISLDGVEPINPPKGSPLRFHIGRLVEITDFSSWADIGSLMAPLYAKAAILPSEGPLTAEVARIRALSSDPKLRAEAALALVQDRVRYVALAMGEGGLVPASAESTWSRRFGDCKGKTALLLGLLAGLGIEAEPVLVNSRLADGLNERLPMVGLFNHVLVRAQIGGRSYWLDGTRTGDKSLDAIRPPAFGWGLPVRAAGSSLTRILPPPLAQPSQETVIRIDATGGLIAPSPTRIEMLTRGDEALGVNMWLANLAPSARDRALRAYWKEHYDLIDVKSASAAYDAVKGEHRLVMEGFARMDWAGGRYETDGTGVGYKADFSRDPGPDSDAPYAVDYPSFSRIEQTILLPMGGKGFSVSAGAEIDRTVAGIAYRRHAAITDNVFRIETTERSVAPEFPAREAPVAQVALAELAGKTVYLIRPAGYRATGKDIAGAMAAPTTTVEGFLDRGYLMLEERRYDLAISDFDSALKLDPRNADALANRGIARAWKQDAGAQRDLDAAAAIEPRHAVVFRARGLLAQQKEAWAEAIAAYTTALEIEPRNSFALGRRAEVYYASGDTDGALVDAAAAIKLDPAWVDLYLLRANLLRGQGRETEAVAAAAALAQANPDVQYAQVVAARIYGTFKRHAEAMRAYDRAIAIKPEAYIYINRSESQPKENFAARRADLDAAAKLEPNSPDVLAAMARLHEDSGDHAAAIASWTTAIAAEPGNGELLLGRAVAYARAGRTALAEKDFTAGRVKAVESSELNNVCWAKATAGVALASALADCDAALGKSRDNAMVLDSRGLVLLRLGRLDEALASYDRALAKRPAQASSLFGRAVIWSRKGDKARTAADLAAAMRADPDIQDHFKRYGITL